MAAPGKNPAPVIIVRRVKKRGHAHHGGAWKVAYADFVTAMMAFFMLLWLIANPDKQQLKGLADYFSPAPPNTSASMSMGKAPGDSAGDGGRTRRAQAESKITTGQPTPEAATAGTSRGGTAKIPDASMRMLAQEMRVAIDSVPEARDNAAAVRIEPTRDGMRINLMDTAKLSMFRGGTAQLNDYARNMLVRIAEKLAKSGSQIAIEGHTDATGGANEANWRLSSERALAARAALAGGGLRADRFAEVVALGSTRPVYPDQPERAENRRITVVVLGESSALPSDASFKF